MSEQAPDPETLHTILLHERTLADWHAFLTYDQETGEDTSNLTVPCSRYGRTSADAAWWAIAAEMAYVDACGDDHEGDEALEYLQGLAVNDSDSIAELVKGYWHAIPQAVRDVLGEPEAKA